MKAGAHFHQGSQRRRQRHPFHQGNRSSIARRIRRTSLISTSLLVKHNIKHVVFLCARFEAREFSEAVHPPCTTRRAMMAVEGERSSGGFFKAVQYEPLWFYSEDDHGRYRVFPKHLNDLVEQEYQKWLREGMPLGFVTTFVWQGSGGTTDYEIYFSTMVQKNLRKDTARPVKRCLQPLGGTA